MAGTKDGYEAAELQAQNLVKKLKALEEETQMRASANRALEDAGKQLGSTGKSFQEIASGLADLTSEIKQINVPGKIKDMNSKIKLMADALSESTEQVNRQLMIFKWTTVAAFSALVISLIGLVLVFILAIK